MEAGFKGYDTIVSATTRGTTPDNIYDAAVYDEHSEVSLISDNRFLMGYLAFHIKKVEPILYANIFYYFGDENGKEFLLFDKTINGLPALTWCITRLRVLNIIAIDSSNIVTLDSYVDRTNEIDYKHSIGDYDVCCVSKCMAEIYNNDISNMIPCGCNVEEDNTKFEYTLPLKLS